jgi:hypothetical protein
MEGEKRGRNDLCKIVEEGLREWKVVVICREENRVMIFCCTNFVSEMIRRGYKLQYFKVA